MIPVDLLYSNVVQGRYSDNTVLSVDMEPPDVGRWVRGTVLSRDTAGTPCGRTVGGS